MTTPRILPAILSPVLLVACAQVDGPLILTAELPDGRVQMAYEATLEVDLPGGDEAWSLVDGDLPPGLALGNDGVLSGTPTGSGTYGFTVEVDDGYGVDEVPLELTVPHVLLMSGYEPFGTYDTNPSIEALWPLQEEIIAGLDVRVIEVPVVWDESWMMLLDEIETLDPVAVVATGVAGSNSMRLETLAVNVQEGTDNDGVGRNGEPNVQGGDESLDTGLPVTEMAEAMEAAGSSTMISDDAGTYLCNHIFYLLMNHIEYEASSSIVGGFIHVPPAPNVSFQVEDITTAHEAGIGALAIWMGTDGSRRAPERVVHEAPQYF